MKLIFTGDDVSDAIKHGIFDEYNNTIAKPTQVILYFEAWANLKAKDLRHAAAKIALTSETQDWTDVNVAVPKLEQWVLVTDGKQVEKAMITRILINKNGRFYDWSTNAIGTDDVWFDVTHWMPIPELPNIEKK